MTKLTSTTDVVVVFLGGEGGGSVGDQTAMEQLQPYHSEVTFSILMTWPSGAK